MTVKRPLIVVVFLLLCLALCACKQQETPEPLPEPSNEPTADNGEFPEQEVDTYTVMEGTSEENTVTVISSEKEGPCVYIVGGIHGDETAGWTAAHELKDEIEIGCGTLYILEPVNRSGAEENTRFVVGSGDINRAFPGNIQSTDTAEMVAGSLFAEIERLKPDLVLDLHEAQAELGEGPSNKGVANTLIYTLDTPISDLLFDFVISNEQGEVAHRKFGLTTPGVAGSFNRVVSEELGIPVITVETWRSLALEERIAEQKEIVLFCLNHIGMAARLKT